MSDHKTQRRKRHDSQSRQFVCKCGRKYLSYAAVYTHVKNKHESQKDMLKNIMRPEKTNLTRGRPKQKKQYCKNKDSELLSISEKAILEVHNSLKSERDYQNIILAGDKDIDVEKLKIMYDQTQEKYKQLAMIIQNPGSAELRAQAVEFTNAITKHFEPKVAAQVKFVIGYMGNNLVPQGIFGQNNSKTILQNLNKCNIWHGHDNINQALLQSFLNWVNVNHKN